MSRRVLTTRMDENNLCLIYSDSQNSFNFTLKNGNVTEPHPRAGSCPGAVGQHKMNSVVLLWTFCFVLLCFGISCLSAVLHVG